MGRTSTRKRTLAWTGNQSTSLGIGRGAMCVSIVRMDGRRVEDSVMFGTTAYMAAYMIIMVVSMMIVAIGKSEETATQVTSLIMAGAAVVAYIIGEGLADAAAAVTETDSDEQ